MPIFIASLIGALLPAITSIVGRVVLALGLSFVTFQGFDILFEWVADSIHTNFDGLPSDVVGFLGYMWVDKMISIIISAVMVMLSFKVLDGVIKRMV